MKNSIASKIVLRRIVIGLMCFALCGCLHRTTAPAIEMTPQAQLTYAALLLDQSERTDCVTGVLDAADIFLKYDSHPVPYIIEATGWLLVNKQTAFAYDLFKRAIAAIPDELSLRILLAEAYSDESRFLDAIDVMQDFLKLHPQSQQGRQELGILLHKAGRSQEAVALLSSLPEKNFEKRTRLIYGHALMSVKKYKAAVRQFSKTLKAYPESDEAREALTYALAHTGNIAQARSLYQYLLEKYPENDTFHLRYMVFELKNSRPKAALSIAQHGAIKAYSPQFCISAANLLLENGYASMAEYFMRQQIKRHDASDELRIFHAVALYVSSHNLKATLQTLDSISEQSPARNRVLYTKAQVLINANKKEEASRVLDNAIAEFPNDKDLALLAARFYDSHNQQKKSCSILDSLAAQYPTDTEILFIQASTHDFCNDKNGALAIMEHILSLDPNNYKALNYIGYRLAELSPQTTSPEKLSPQLTRSLQLLKQAVSLAPDKAYILDSLAWAQFKAGDLTSAWKNICATVKMKGGDTEAEIWEHYGDIALALKNYKQAQYGWKKSLSMQKNTRVLDKIKQLNKAVQ